MDTSTPVKDKDTTQKEEATPKTVEKVADKENDDMDIDVTLASSQNLPTPSLDITTTDRAKLATEQSKTKVSQDLFYKKPEEDGDGSGSSDLSAGIAALEEDNLRKKKLAKQQLDIDSSPNNNDVRDSGSDGRIEDLQDLIVEEVAPEGDTQQSSSHRSPRSSKVKPVGMENDLDESFEPLKDILGESFYEDEDSSEDEGMPDYKIGGYHPIHVGEILMDRYVIIQKLGWGHFSTVWLTKDLKYNSYVALKVQKSAQHYVEAAYDEVDILDQVASNWATDEWKASINEYYKHDSYLQSRIDKYGVMSESSHCAQLLNSFIHHGPNGKHFIMVFEILGVNFLEIIKRYDYKGVPLPLVRRLARQCLIGLDYMHRMCQMIHTDFKPENVVICLRDEEVHEIH